MNQIVSKHWIAAGALVWIVLAGAVRSSMAQTNGLAATNSAPLAAVKVSNSFHEFARRLDAVEAENAFLRREVERLNAAANASGSSVTLKLGGSLTADDAGVVVGSI